MRPFRLEDINLADEGLDDTEVHDFLRDKVLTVLEDMAVQFNLAFTVFT